MKSIVITGSSRGIGLGLAKEFLKRGCSVTISARGKNKLDEEVRNLSEEFGGDKVCGRPCDVTDYDQVQQLWDAAVEKFGRVDIWLNNAGVSPPLKLLWELEPAQIAPVINTNITGLMYGCKVALQGMLKQGCGQIYNFEGHGSNDSTRAGMTVYGTTKRAVRYLSESLLDETEDKPVQIGTISPGIVVTDLLLEDLRHMTPERLAEVKVIFNVLADTVETVTPYLAEEVLKNDKTDAKISWLTPEKTQARFEDPEYLERDLLSRFGI